MDRFITAAFLSGHLLNRARTYVGSSGVNTRTTPQGSVVLRLRLRDATVYPSCGGQGFASAAGARLRPTQPANAASVSR
jgi:hypothetical protein